MSKRFLARRGVLLLAIISAIALGALVIRAQQQHDMHGSMTQKQMDEMHKRGNEAMGFDQLKTTHHFLLASDGGSIQVQANDAKDTERRDQIRQHLRHIATMFKAGNFDVPMQVHAQAPPGSEAMQRLKADISYKFKEIENGGSIRISTNNGEALRAIHEFLRFQITEHKTGDSLDTPAK